MDNKGAFIKLSENNFRVEVLANKHPVLVEFRADWSGTCDIMSPILEDLSTGYAGRIAIGTIDADENKNLTDEYGVTYLPTFVFFLKGQVVDHVVGAVPKPVIVEKIERLIRNNGDLK
jgi:thioredoxin 1